MEKASKSVGDAPAPGKARERSTRQATPARAQQVLRFCRAFFEIVDGAETARRLRVLAEAIEPSGDLAEGSWSGDGVVRSRVGVHWFLWEPDRARPREGAPFLIRLHPTRLVLEAASGDQLARGWRLLDERLRPAARARVAAGDELTAYAPRPPPGGRDDPDSYSPAQREEILREVYARYEQQWAVTPQPRLDGLTPREAAARPELQGRLLEMLDRLQKVEEERVRRGQLSFSVDTLRRSVGLS